MVRASSQKRHLSAIAAIFTTDLATLGEQGFATWLMQSFAGSRPEHQEGYFHYNDPLLFHQAFRSIAWELPEGQAGIAKAGTARALGTFDPSRGTCFGCLEISGVAEALGIEVAPSLTRILSAWLPAHFDREVILRQTNIVALRELFEISYRQICHAASSGDLTGYRELCRLAHLIINYRERDLAPLYAPLYILATVHLVHFAGTNDCFPRRELNRLKLIIESAALDDNRANSELYTFESIEYFGRFPYDVDRLMPLANAFLALLRRDRQQPRLTEALVRFDDPLTSVPATATTGTAHPSLGLEYREMLLDELLEDA